MKKQILHNITELFKDQNILVIGDIILDHYIYGNVSRISPEAPVPIIHKISEEYRLGGSANVAANIRSLSGKVTLMGFVGKDLEGETIIKLAKEKGINIIPTYTSQTTKKTRIISNNQQHIRIDYEDNFPKYFDKEIIQNEAKKADLIIISDYAKGSITKELIEILLKETKKIIVDPKPKNKSFYKGVRLITPNKKEALEMASCSNELQAGEILKEELMTDIIITNGQEGMIIFNEGIKNIPTYAKEVYDISGAGDTVIATLGLSLSAGSNLEIATELANYTAGIVVGKKGTTSVSLLELKNKLLFESSKIKTHEELKELIKNHKKENKKIVWTNGCFDILHPGHIDYLKKSKELGNTLIVGLNSDESVKKLKGENRPLQSEWARANIISSLEFVDYVIIFNETDVTKYLSSLKPHIFSKGGDYKLNSINQAEKRIIERYNGRIEIIPIIKKDSTTEIINKAKK